jgi:hypothetical protein
MYEVSNPKTGRRAVVSESPNPKYKYRLVMYQDDLSTAVEFGNDHNKLVYRADKHIREASHD